MVSKKTKHNKTNIKNNIKNTKKKQRGGLGEDPEEISKILSKYRRADFSVQNNHPDPNEDEKQEQKLITEWKSKYHQFEPDTLLQKPEILKFHQKFNVSSFKKIKSSLKFCVVATGEFDLYIADARACEWDIAAGHAILENAGGIVTDFNGNEITYGKKDFKNPSIILKRSKNL